MKLHLSGRTLKIGKHVGECQYNFEFNFSVDKTVWHTVFFENLGDAREYAAQLLKENAENQRFRCYVRRLILVDTRDFFDTALEAAQLRVISKHSDPYR